MEKEEFTHHPQVKHLTDLSGGLSLAWLLGALCGLFPFRHVRYQGHKERAVLYSFAVSVLRIIFEVLYLAIDVGLFLEEES